MEDSTKSVDQKITTQKRRLSVVLGIVIIIAITVAYQCAPLFYSAETLSLLYDKPLPEDLPKDFTAAVHQAAGKDVALGQPFVFDIDWLISTSYQLYASDVNNQIKWRQELKPFVRRERFVAMVMLVAFIFSLNFIYGNVAAVTPRDANGAPQWTVRLPSVNASMEDVLLGEMNNAWFIARRFYNWSLYLLASGVGMAFFGMGIFVITMPATDIFFRTISIMPAGELPWKMYVIFSVRPFGLLVFMEAIAWFLLRQYRSSTEDFKAFHRIYLRRSNYFAARRSLDETNQTASSALLAATLLTEDLSGRLTQGQTTEALESMKIDEANPVFGIFANLLDHAKKKARSPETKESTKKVNKGAG